MWNEALEQFEDVLRIGGKDANVFTSKGLVLLEMGRPWDAVSALHEALGISPQDPVATDILGRALEESAAQGGFGGQHSNRSVDDDDEGGRHDVDDAVDEEFERIVAAGRREVEKMKIAKGKKAQMRMMQQQQQRQSPQAAQQQQRPRVTQARSAQARERGSVGGDDPFTGGHGGLLNEGLRAAGGDESMLMSSDEE